MALGRRSGFGLALKWLPKAVEPTVPAIEGVSRFMPAVAERAAGRGQPGRRQEAGRTAEAARARAVRGP